MLFLRTIVLSALLPVLAHAVPPSGHRDSGIAKSKPVEIQAQDGGVGRSVYNERAQLVLDSIEMLEADVRAQLRSLDLVEGVTLDEAVVEVVTEGTRLIGESVTNAIDTYITLPLASYEGSLNSRKFSVVFNGHWGHNGNKDKALWGPVDGEAFGLLTVQLTQTYNLSMNITVEAIVGGEISAGCSVTSTMTYAIDSKLVNVLFAPDRGRSTTAEGEARFNLTVGFNVGARLAVNIETGQVETYRYPLGHPGEAVLINSTIEVP